MAICSCAFILSVAISGSADAQQGVQQSRPDPHQAEKSFETLQEQRRANRTTVQVPAVAKPEIPADTRPLFKLTAVSVAGASVIAGSAIAETYRSYIGKTVSQSDLVAIAGKISNLYRDAGYHLSRAIVPPQDIKDGAILIQVIEGQITDIVLNGKGADQFGLRSLLGAVAQEHPSRLKTLERQLMLANDRPGVRIADTALEEIGEATGNFRLTVTAETWQVYAAQGLDTLGSSAVGPWQAYSTTAFNSALVKGDTLGINLSTTPGAPRELGYGRLSYDAPVGNDGARLGATALYSDVRPGDRQRQQGVYTETDTYELKGSVVPLETRRSSLWLTATAGYSDVSGREWPGINYSDHFRTVSLTADYKLQDDIGGWNYLTLIGRHGLDILGASQKGDPFLSRYGASGDFSVFDFFFTRYQKLSDIWSLKLSASGQLASTVLLTSQQFYLGGAAYGPGYYSGDNGIAGSVELRFDQTLQSDMVKGYQLYGFVDRGAVWNFDSKNDVFSLSSVGAGVRLYLADQLQAGVAVAVPFRYRITANDVHSPRILFSLTNSFKFCPDRPEMRCL